MEGMLLWDNRSVDGIVLGGWKGVSEGCIDVDGRVVDATGPIFQRTVSPTSAPDSSVSSIVVFPSEPLSLSNLIQMRRFNDLGLRVIGT